MIEVKVVPKLDMIPYSDYNMPYLPKFDYTAADFWSDERYEYELTETHSDRQVFMENVDIATILPLDSNGRLLTDWVKFDKFDEYDMSIVSVTHDLSLAFWIMPFEYCPETRTLYFIPDFNVTIKIKKRINKTQNDI